MVSKMRKLYVFFIILLIAFITMGCGDSSSSSSDSTDPTDPTITDSVSPSNLSVSINGGDSSTDTVNVTLSLSATDDTGVVAHFVSKSSAAPSNGDAGWVLVTSTKNYSADVAFTLSSTPGTKTVYAWFKDAAENVSTIANNTITLLDNSPPTSPSISINSGDISTGTLSVTLNLSALDDLGVAAYLVSENSTTPLDADGRWVSFAGTTSYSEDVAFTLSNTVGTKTVYAWFKDTSGNISTVTNNTITLFDGLPPVSTSILIDGGATATSSLPVTLTLSALDEFSVTAYLASENSTTPLDADGRWVPFTGTAAYSADVAFTLSSTPSTKTVYTWFKDADGNISTVASDTIILSDNSSPTNELITINAGDASTDALNVTLSLDASDDASVVAYLVSENSTPPLDVDGRWVFVISTPSYSADVSFTLSATSGTKTVYAWFKDNTGNISGVASDTINLSIISSILVSWTANREQGVNQTGGGYKVYYSTTPGFDPASAPLVNVPWISGPTAPVSTILAFTVGTYYIKVVAYSTLNSTGSLSSLETSVTAP